MTKQKLSRTRKILSAMLKENTGRAMMDSGGTPQYNEQGQYIGSTEGYGRGFERNQGVDFEAQPAARLELTDLYRNDGSHLLEWNIIFSTYHWLASRLEYDGKLQGQFTRFAKKAANRDESWLANMQEFPLYLRERGKHVTFIYGDEVSEFSATYSYNDENCLSQDIQFVYFELDRDPYVLLQTHNGCDARGGLTAPKAFRVSGNSDGTCIWDYARVSLVGSRPEADRKADDAQMKISGVEERRMDRIIWDSENAGYRFNLANSDGWDVKSALQLQDYPRTNDLSFIGKGHVVVDKANGKLYCPLSGWSLRPYFI